MSLVGPGGVGKTRLAIESARRLADHLEVWLVELAPVSAGSGTTDGGDAITAAYQGTADIDAETCNAVMTITVGAAELPAEDGVDCFAT